MGEEVGQGLRRLSTGVMRTFVIVAAVVLFASSPVFATLSYTTVYSPPSGEKNHAQILSLIYGGYFTKIGTSVNYENAAAGVKARRVYDDNGSDIKLNLLSGDPNDVDQIWTDGTATVTAEAKYAGDSQSFGWNGGGTGTTYTALLTHLDIPTQREVELVITEDFLWGYHPDGYQWWSLNENNSDSKDHFITYKIEGLGGPDVVWLLFMEDLPCSQADRDYNDFVVEIAAVPEPATAFLLVSGIALLLRKR